jgi:WD40 repeat protein
MKRSVVLLAVILILCVFVSIIAINKGSSSVHAQDPYPDTIYKIAWNPDGTKIAAASGTGIHIWDAESPDDDPIETFEVVGGANSLAWSPDGDKIAIGHWDGYISVWDRVSQSYIVSTEKYGPLQQVTSIGWSADGTRVFSIGFFDGGFIIWNPSDLSLLDSEILGGYDFDVNSDHTSVVQGTAGTVVIRDVSTGEITQSWPSHDLGTTSIAWSPDETMVTGGGGDDESVIYVWDVNNLESPLAELQGHSSYIQTIDWGENNLIASADTDQTIRIWDGTTFQLITSLPNTSDVLAWSPDGTKLAYSGSGVAIEVIDAPLPSHAQDPNATFVQISSIELLQYDMNGWPPFVSLNQDYVYDCGIVACWLWERSSNDAIFRTGEDRYLSNGFCQRY